MHFVIHAVDKPGIIETRAKHFRAHRLHLDESRKHGVEIFTAGSLVDEDGETPVGSLLVVEAGDRLRLVLKPADLVGRDESCGLDHLQGHRAVEAELAGLVDDAHAPFAQHFQKLVVAEISDASSGRKTGISCAVQRIGRRVDLAS